MNSKPHKFSRIFIRLYLSRITTKIFKFLSITIVWMGTFRICKMKWPMKIWFMTTRTIFLLTCGIAFCQLVIFHKKFQTLTNAFGNATLYIVQTIFRKKFVSYCMYTTTLILSTLCNWECKGISNNLYSAFIAAK